MAKKDSKRGLEIDKGAKSEIQLRGDLQQTCPNIIQLAEELRDACGLLYLFQSS